MERWVCPVSATTASTGNWTQLYPSWAPAGVDPAAATNGQQIRKPVEGVLFSLQLQTDGTNAGVIELYDASGADAGADVSSATTVTQAQLTALIARGLAKQIYSQNFIASPETPINLGYAAFQRGLLARFAGSAGSVNLNLSVEGGFYLTTKVG